MYGICANYDVMCFDYVDGVQVIDHEYFDTYEEALEFERTQTEHEFVSITPMNYEAEMTMRRN